MKKDNNPNTQIIVALIAATAVIIGAYLSYLSAVAPKLLEIGATQTAEAKLTAVAQIFALTPVNNSPDLTSTPTVEAITSLQPTDLTSTIEATINLQPTETPSNYTDPTQFIRNYYSLLNNRQYKEAWSKLSTKFQTNLTNRGVTYDEYVSFWDTVDQIEIVLFDIKSQNNSEVYIYTEIMYHYKTGNTETGHTTYKLVKDSSNTSWLFDPN